jgi:leucyl-tRNA synthetase
VEETRKSFDLSISTTRPETIFGVTFICLSPFHPLLSSLTNSVEMRLINSFLKSQRNVKTDDSKKFVYLKHCHAVRKITDRKKK